MILSRCWIYEWAELESVLTKAESGSVKAFLSSSADAFRPPYDRTVISHPRSAIVVGSTNHEQFLSDSTGNRRFWVITIKDKIDIESLRAQREQLWAEAAHLYLGGEPWHLDAEHEAERASRETQYVEGDLWDERVEIYLAARSVVSAPEILTHLGLEPAKQDTWQNRRIAAILRRLAWKPGFEGIKRRRVWIKG